MNFKKFSIVSNGAGRGRGGGAGRGRGHGGGAGRGHGGDAGRGRGRSGGAGRGRGHGGAGRGRGAGRTPPLYLRRHKCKKGCGRNAATGYDTCCRQCGCTDGSEGVHDKWCKVSENLYYGLNACDMAAQAHRSGVNPAYILSAPPNTPLPKTMTELWQRGWVNLIDGCLRYIDGCPVTIVVCGWGTGVYKNPVEVVVKGLVHALHSIQCDSIQRDSIQRDVEVVWCDLKDTNKQVLSILANEAASYGVSVKKEVGDVADVSQRLAKHYAGTRMVFCLNCANGLQPGGGAANGRNAQEEGLCRNVKNLFGSLLKVSNFHLPGETLQDWYHGHWKMAVTFPCWVARDPNGESSPFAVVSAAAPNMTHPSWVGFPRH